MRKVKVSNILSIFISASLLLAASACGKEPEEVTDYGGDLAASQVDTATQSDPVNYEQAGGQTLRDRLGGQITWKEDVAVGGYGIKIDSSLVVPDLDSVNVYKVQQVDDGKADEQALVESLFDGPAEKLDEIKYVNETDYITMLYKYRKIKQTLYDEHAEGFFVIKADTETDYKWLDDEDNYIHMYKGKYNGIDYGLILAYSQKYHQKFIFFDPISIKDYFPDKNYKTLLYESTGDFVGTPLEVENACKLSEDEVYKMAGDFLEEKLSLNSVDRYLSNNFENYAIRTNNMLYLYGSAASISMLTFSDVDYYSSERNSTSATSMRHFDILADQKDLVAEGMEKFDKDYDEFMSLGTSAGVEKPNLETDGYAVYLSHPSEQLSSVSDGYMVSDINTGVIRITSKGFYGMDLMLYYDTQEVVEDVEILEFDQIKECFKDEFKNIDFNKLGDDKSLDSYYLSMTYEFVPDKTNPQRGDFVPTWTLALDGSEGYCMININAIDGSCEYNETENFSAYEDNTSSGE